MSIKIKKSHKGLLHKDLGISSDKPIPSSKLRIKSSDSPAVRKRKNFAIQARKWNHADDGMDINPMSITLADAINTGLLTVDALLPKEKSKMPVVRPQTTYNPYPYGQMDDGGVMYRPKTYETGEKMPKGKKAPINDPSRYAAWGDLAPTVRDEGFTPTLWNKNYTEYTPNYTAAGRNVMIDSQPKGDAVVRGGNNGKFDVIIRDSEGTHPDFFVKQGVSAEDAHSYFVNKQSTVNQHVNSLAQTSHFNNADSVGNAFTEIDKSRMKRPQKKSGGKLKRYYEDGGEYDMSNDEVKSLISAGYDIELL